MGRVQATNPAGRRDPWVEAPDALYLAAIEPVNDHISGAYGGRGAPGRGLSAMARPPVRQWHALAAKALGCTTDHVSGARLRFGTH